MRLIFEDEFGLLHIQFDSMVKIRSLAQFPVDHLSYPVMPSLIFLLH